MYLEIDLNEPKQVVYALWWNKGLFSTYLLGLYTTVEKAKEAEERYRKDAALSQVDGWFQALQILQLDTDLRSGLT